MARLDDWQSNLTNLINDNRNKPFDFPTYNCLLWAMAGIKAVTGKDLAKAYIGKIPNEKAGALALRHNDNVKTSEELLSKYLGQFQAIAFARLGDIVFLSPTNGEYELPADLKLFGPVPGICYGTLSYFLGEQGLVEIPTLQLDKALWVS